MPYINGVRVSQEEWIRREGSKLQFFATSERGENPGGKGLDEAADAPVAVPDEKPQRSKRSAKGAKKAIADAMGVKDNSPVLDDIDVSGLASEDE